MYCTMIFWTRKSPNPKTLLLPVVVVVVTLFEKCPLPYSINVVKYNSMITINLDDF